MHNILAIMGSPRKGDTYHLTRQIEATMSGLGDVGFDYLWLRDADLRMCRGCCACFERGEEHCPLDDDRAEIEQRILAANGVIFASPVYALGMTALMKNLLDRFAYALHRPRFFDQKALIVVSAGAAGVRVTQKSLAYVRYMGFDMSGGRVGLTMLPKPWTQAELRAVHVETQRAGRRFFRALQHHGHRAPSFMETAYFRLQQAAFAVNREEQPTDYEYFAERGWLNPARKWYVDAPVNPFYDLAARAVAGFVRRQALGRQRTLKEEAPRRKE
ncbi:MAG: flavodoxin family protein [Armatimonadota bacterium]|jgi:multimeric flavodoxin WrbA